MQICKEALPGVFTGFYCCSLGGANIVQMNKSKGLYLQVQPFRQQGRGI